MAVNIQPQPSSTVNTRTPSVPQHEVGGMGDDLTVHGDFRHGGGSDGARAGCSRASPGATRLRETRKPRQIPKPSPDLAVSLALPGGCLQVGLDGHQQSLVRDRGLRSPALCWFPLSGGLLPGFHARRTRNGQNLRPHRPAGGRRPNPCRERWRHSSPRPPPPQRAGRLRLGVQQWTTCMINSPIRFMAMSSSAFSGSPLRSLQARHRSAAIAFSRHCIEPENLHAQLPRQKFGTGSPRKSRSRQPHALRVTVHRWPSPSGPARRNLAFGENVDEPSSASFTTGPSISNFVLKELSVMFRSSLDTSIKPILCPRKSGPTQDCPAGPARRRSCYAKPTGRAASRRCPDQAAARR